MEKKKPDFIVKSVVKTGKTKEDGKEENRWTDIGVAFWNPKSETFTIYLNALPIGDKMVLTKPRPPKEERPAPEYNPKKGVWGA